MTTEATTQDLGKLTTQADELRGAMMTALGKADDNTVRKLGNELAQVNRQILEVETKSQGTDRDTYRDSVYDALNLFETDGLMLSVRFSADNGIDSIAFLPTEDTISAIKAAVAEITRPSSAIRWAYTWSLGEDGKMHQEFDFGGTARRTPNTSPDTNGTRMVGWTSPDGASITLGNAFDACASDDDKAKLGTLTGGSATNAHKVRIVTAAGYKKL